MNGQSWYVIVVLAVIAVITALVLGVPPSFVAAVTVLACYVTYRLFYRPSSVRRDEADWIVRGKSPAKHVITRSDKLPPSLKVILFLMALGVSFFAGAVWQRANDATEMQQMLQVHRVLKADLPTKAELDKRIAAEAKTKKLVD